MHPKDTPVKEKEHERLCAQCGKPMPERARKAARVCSRACSREIARQKLKALREAGEDPAHGGEAADARREALDRRRKVRDEAKASGSEYVNVRHLAVKPLTEEEEDERWRASGEKWESVSRKAHE